MRFHWLALLLAACISTPQATRAKAALPIMPPDILVILLDDVADSDIDAIETPAIDALAAQGVRFRRAYAHAWCAPTRDALMHGTELGYFRGDACASPTADAAPVALVTLAESLQEAGYSTCHVGKWHHGPAAEGPWQDSYLEFGFNAIRHGREIGEECGAGVNRDGAIVQPTGPDTLACRDALLEWWAETPPPRFALVGFAAAHAPFQVPPPSLWPPGYEPPQFPTNRQAYEAEVRGADLVVGQILAAIDPAVVVLAGDNGTPDGAVRTDQDPTRVKLSCYEDGVRVPLIVRAPGALETVESEALVSIADLAPTLCELAGASVESFSVPSFAGCLTGEASKRETVVVWSGPTSQAAAAIGPQWKLLRRADGVEELYDLETDPLEEAALAPTGEEADALRAAREKHIE